MSVVISVSLTELVENLLDRAAKRTGLSRSEIIRRLIVAYAADESANDILPTMIDRQATEAFKKIIG